ncbi:hypothetical protein Tco_0982216 [Tanacetum coccineum]
MLVPKSTVNGGTKTPGYDNVVLHNLDETGEPLPTEAAAPVSPTLSTTASNEPDITETEISKPSSRKTTPPTNQQPVQTEKELKIKDPPKSSARRSPFTDDQEKPSETSKKMKHEDPRDHKSVRNPMT